MASTNETVFCGIPNQLFSDTDYSVKPPAYSTLDSLIESLKNCGPLVAEAKLGPQAYSGASFKLTDSFSGQSVYGWRPGAAKAHAASIDVILVGAQRKSEKGYVYYVLAHDVTLNTSSLIRGYKPSFIDKKVYIISYNNFLNRTLVDLHPPCPHAEALYLTMDVNAILDGGEVEKRCKEIGQEIFDHYKSQAKGDSMKGKYALQRICEAARFLGSDGPVRTRHIECAWDGVGDSEFFWLG